jgi:hypothetical protein
MQHTHKPYNQRGAIRELPLLFLVGINTKIMQKNSHLFYKKDDYFFIEITS